MNRQQQQQRVGRLRVERLRAERVRADRVRAGRVRAGRVRGTMYLPYSFCSKVNWHYCCIWEVVEILDFSKLHHLHLVSYQFGNPHTNIVLKIDTKKQPF
jgi:hypothetical protein